MNILISYVIRLTKVLFIFFIAIIIQMVPKNAMALPIVIYQYSGYPIDIIGYDDSVLASIILTEVQYGVKSDATKTFGSLNNCSPVKLCQDDEYKVTTGWTKTYNTTINASVNTEISAKFKGIGATIGSSLGTTVNVGEEVTKTIETTKTVHTCATCESFDLVSRDIYNKYSGTISWYYDDYSPGFTTMTDTWSILEFTGTTTEVANYKKCTDPPCPEPSTVLLLGIGALGMAYKSRCKVAVAVAA
jgi:hypothetical protein